MEDPRCLAYVAADVIVRTMETALPEESLMDNADRTWLWHAHLRELTGRVVAAVDELFQEHTTS